MQLDTLDLKPVLSVAIQQEQDLVTARQRARQLSTLLGFGPQDQTRIATAVSEIARNAYQYARRGRLDFFMELRSRPQRLWIQITDSGPGISDVEAVLAGNYVSPSGMGIGLAGTSRLMDEFQIASSAAQGTTIRFAKALPAGSTIIEMARMGQVCRDLAQQQTGGAGEELERQNRDLLQTLDALRQRETELEGRQFDLSRLNVELEETNRGVMALYSELDEKADALRRADEMKSRFLSHVTHEFRTPVNSVLALTRLLLDRTDGDLLPEQEKQIAYIQDAARQLGEIVNDLLDLAKVESGKTELRISVIDLGQFLGATRALMRPLANNTEVALLFDEPPSPVFFESDEGKLGQILRNLISNALKFTQWGEVRVSAHLSSCHQLVVFTVTDTGIGIVPEDQERIFHEFTQIENPIQRQVKGTGLGLPLSLKLAELLGGNLTVRSAIGIGSTFSLTLPYRLSIQAAQSSALTGPRQSKTILIVDDEPASRYLAHRLLRGTSHKIIEASGLEAAERARLEMPVLILLDLVMPDRSGFEVLGELKSEEQTRNIPVVIHTSKVVSDADYGRLEGRQSALLPKHLGNRLAALVFMREVLGEPYLFSAEPEFSPER